MNSPSPLILYVITDLELGGVPLHLSRLAPAMRDRGFEAAVVSLAPVGPVGPILRGNGLEVSSCNGCCGFDFRIVPRLGEIIDARQPAIIHSLLFHANQAARLAAALAGFPAARLIAEIQTVEVERPWHLRVDRWTHRLSRLTIGNSPSVVEHLHRHARIPQDRLCLVPGGIDVDRIARATPADRKALGLSESDRVILWAGRLDPVKGLDHLLHAIRALDPQLRARLLIPGDGPERSRLESLAAQLTLGNRVSFLGPRTDVPSLLKAADMFVFPSRTEGLPNALLEAMAAGLPIVATDVPGCRDLITHERTGLLVPFGDPATLSAAISRMLRDSAYAQQLGRAAHAEAGLNWSITTTWDAYEAIYREALT